LEVFLEKKLLFKRFFHHDFPVLAGGDGVGVGTVFFYLKLVVVITH
jgi:hypothetical protein